ncbi:regulatory iron-sulfur-containing complex subunit RicT [Compostibacter hankyongensis]|uniref:Regulatory iron-sulfur-containing complex subunit RicT n=1 Tax=Compostibacter hankyongensis TaxID=1007089 RepID=A0ABP8G4K3_9BACT
MFDWLADIPLSDQAVPYDIVEISFNNGSRKDFYRNTTRHLFEKGEPVTVEGVGGFDVGEVSLTGELVKLQMKKHRVQDTPDIKKILRRSTEGDIEKQRSSKAREKDALIRSRAIARQLKLEMKLAEVEIQADGRKATFFYTADERVDFRELIRVYAGEFRVKVEMRQIGARQEAGKVGGIGSCGRELCCSTWLTAFKSVNTTAARYQNLSINQSKLSGQCGRLKCCLNYELDTYLDALRDFPEEADTLETAGGIIYLQKRDIFKNLMWYAYQGSSKSYPLAIERVKEIQNMNRQGEKPEELKAVELEVVVKEGEEEHAFVDVVGQISLRSLERNSRKRREKQKQKGRDRQPQSGDKPARDRDRQPQNRDRQGQPQGRDRQPRDGRPPKPQASGKGQGPTKGQGQQRPQRSGQGQPQRKRPPEKEDPDTRKP